VSTSALPRLFEGLVDDAAVFPPGSAPLPDAVADHRRHRSAWYAAMVGPLLVPASAVASGALAGLVGPDDATAGGGLELGLIGDRGLADAGAVAAGLAATGPRLRRLETAVAAPGEDPRPGLRQLAQLAAELPGVEVSAELSLTPGLIDALAETARLRAAGFAIAAKFRTGGLTADRFPPPDRLAEVICACRDHALPFKLTAGLHRAVRHTDPATGFVHHGFLNVLAATLAAAGGATVSEVADLLATRDPAPLVGSARAHRDDERPLWTGYGSCSITEPVNDLTALRLVGETRR
jgi:hypothetical protein